MTEHDQTQLTKQIVEGLPAPGPSKRIRHALGFLFAAMVLFAVGLATAIVVASHASDTASSARNAAERSCQPHDRRGPCVAAAQANDRLRAAGQPTVHIPPPGPVPTVTVTAPAPAARGVRGTDITAGHLFVTYTDGSRVDIGQVIGPRGIPGASGHPGATGPSGSPGQSGQPGQSGGPGPAGRGIANSTITAGHLFVTYTDGTQTDLGQVVGPAGTSITDVTITGGHLIVTLSDGTTRDAGPVPVGPPCPTGYTQATVTPSPITNPGQTWVVCASQ